ncbi:mitochondrial carrier [Ascobolus immersus RN42]|uniref:Mitochondrial carrier n=1 Tax=Ascobolus immersus RN42 TaxID=1160509 RepID=A0A3N4HD98_ASCIM|nr:mitochondrial carrier [Ascobolus immersus RN42]
MSNSNAANNGDSRRDDASKPRTSGSGAGGAQPVKDIAGKVDFDNLTVSGMVKKYDIQLSAFSSSLISTLAAYPLDSIKTRLQTYKYKNLLACVKQTYKLEGAQGFWRGCLAPLASISIVRTVSFSGYTASKELYAPAFETVFGRNSIDHGEVQVDRGVLPRPASLLWWFMAGGTAGSIVSLIACPFELTKVGSQVELLLEKERLGLPASSKLENFKPKSTYQTAKGIVAFRGFRGLYSGLNLHMTRDTIGTGAYFTVYETVKHLLSKNGQDVSPMGIAVAGSLCGLVSWTIVYPFDVHKTQYQKAILAGRTDANGSIFATKFARETYRGLGVSVFRTMLVNSIFFSSYEFLKKHFELKRLAEEQE